MSASLLQWVTLKGSWLLAGAYEYCFPNADYDLLGEQGRSSEQMAKTAADIDVREF